MLKIYKVWLQQLYLLALWFELNYSEPGGSTGDRLQRIMIDYFYKSSSKGWERLPDHGPLVQSILNRGGGGVDLKKILPELNELLLNDHRRSQFEGEGDLINVIVDTLKLPYASNHLSGVSLGALRRQLLFPQERAEFQRKMAKKEMSCNQCGHRFRSGELSTYTNDGFVCSNCYTPNSMGCKHCEESAPMPEKLREGLRKVGDCGCRERKQVDPPPSEAEIPTRVTPMGDNSEPFADALRRASNVVSGRTRMVTFDEAPQAFPQTPPAPMFVREDSPFSTEPPQTAGTIAPSSPSARQLEQLRREFLETNRRTRRRPTNR